MKNSKILTSKSNNLKSSDSFCYKLRENSLKMENSKCFDMRQSCCSQDRSQDFLSIIKQYKSTFSKIPTSDRRMRHTTSDMV